MTSGDRMAADGSVTRWVDGVRSGDDEAMSRFVDRFYGPIVRLVQQRLPSVARRVADEEDVALSALGSFIARMRRGEFDRLAGRDELWRVLVMISKRKAAKHIARATAQKRGGGKVRGESLFRPQPDHEGAGLDQFADAALSPAEQVELLDCVERILQFLDGLNDPTLCAVALLQSEGRSDAEIAGELNCSTRTVERKRKRLHDKAARWAARST